MWPLKNKPKKGGRYPLCKGKKASIKGKSLSKAFKELAKAKGYEFK